MCKNGEFELEVKTTATPEITTTMFDGDGTDQKDYTLVNKLTTTVTLINSGINMQFISIFASWANGDSIFTVVFFQHYNRFVTS
jgi:predicted TIM-barrel enzyme